MRIMDAQYDWIIGSFALRQANEDILFIGRPKNDSIAITLQSGRVIQIDSWGGQQKEYIVIEKMAACVGETLAGTNVGITQENQLMISPST